jgi:hypothetical protein
MASTTTTTTLLGGSGVTETPDTAPEIPQPEGVPVTFLVTFEERYVCQLGPDGESDISSFGAATVEVFPGANAFDVSGSGVMDAEGFVRGGDICTGEGNGTHRFDVSGVIESASDGTLTLELLVAGTWYDTWKGEIVCRGGLPPSGPWEWPPEPNVETLTFSPLEHGATWDKDVTLGRCQGSTNRTVDFESLPIVPITTP